MTELERVHAALTRTKSLLMEMQRIFDLPFCPKADCVILDGFEAINKIASEIAQANDRAEKAEAENEWLRSRADVELGKPYGSVS